MRSIALLSLSLLAAGCAQKSPEQQQIDQIRSDAGNQAKAIEQRAEAEADPLDQQAEALSNQAKEAGGYTEKRLRVKADALQQEARLIREQADKQAMRSRKRRTRASKLFRAARPGSPPSGFRTNI